MPLASLLRERMHKIEGQGNAENSRVSLLKHIKSYGLFGHACALYAIQCPPRDQRTQISAFLAQVLIGAVSVVEAALQVEVDCRA